MQRGKVEVYKLLQQDAFQSVGLLDRRVYAYDLINGITHGS